MGIHINKLSAGGDRRLIEVGDQRIIITDEEYTELADIMSHRLHISGLVVNAFGGLSAVTEAGRQVQLAYSDETPELLRNLLSEVEQRA